MARVDSFSSIRGERRNMQRVRRKGFREAENIHRRRRHEDLSIDNKGTGFSRISAILVREERRTLRLVWSRPSPFHLTRVAVDAAERVAIGEHVDASPVLVGSKPHGSAQRLGLF